MRSSWLRPKYLYERRDFVLFISFVRIEFESHIEKSNRIKNNYLHTTKYNKSLATGQRKSKIRMLRKGTETHLTRRQFSISSLCHAFRLNWSIQLSPTVVHCEPKNLWVFTFILNVNACVVIVVMMRMSFDLPFILFLLQLGIVEMKFTQKMKRSSRLDHKRRWSNW